jgi:hypothetical protein
VQQQPAGKPRRELLLVLQVNSVLRIEQREKAAAAEEHEGGCYLL